MSFLDPPRVYRNMNHETYHPEETQFDPDFATDDHVVTSPTAEQAKQSEMLQAQMADEKPAKEKKKSKKDSKKDGKASAPASDDEAKEDDGKKKVDEKKKSTDEDEATKKSNNTPPAAAAPSSVAAPSSSSSNNISSVESEPDSVFSQLLLESILEQKSVSDFVGGLPDKRGTLLVRFPTTLLGKSWKKRYFTLHGSNLYFHEDQAVIHPSLGASSSMNEVKKGHDGGVQYRDCKKIEIENFWIIQQDTPSPAMAGLAALAQASAAAAAASAASAAATPSAIPADPEIPVGADASKPLSKFDEQFNKGKATEKDAKDAKSKDSKEKDSKEKESKEKNSGPVVRGRRRSSLVLEKGNTVILLMPKEKGVDPLELTGLNEGGMADLAVLTEWVVAINARICLLNFLHNPMNLTAMARGGREILAFLSDASCRTLKIANKFTDLTPVLQHFQAPLSYRGSSSGGPLNFSFENCAMTDSAFQALCAIIESNPSMVVGRVNVARNLITKASMTALHRALKANTHVAEICLDHNQIGDEGIEKLIHGDSAEESSNSISSSISSSIWSYGMDLHSISLAHNQISDRGLENFLQSIMDYLNAASPPDPEAVNEQAGDDSSSAADAASSSSSASSMMVHKFTLLDFSGNQVTDLGVQVLSGFLLANPWVSRVALRANFVTDCGAASLKDVLEDPRSTLADLDIADNQITGMGLGFIVDALKSNNANKAKIALDLSGNTGLDGSGLAKLLELKAPSNPAVWAVNITSLAFTVNDPEAIAQRITQQSPNGVGAVASPRPPQQAQAQQQSGKRSGPAVAAISTSQQNVLDLFSPTAPAQQHQLPQFPLTTAAAAPSSSTTSSVAAPSAVPSAVVAAPSSLPSSATSSPASSTKKPKSDKRASINNPLAPKISIHDAPLPGTVHPHHLPLFIQPPPAFQQPQPSPDGESASASASASSANGLIGRPSSTRSNDGGSAATVSIANPANPTPGADDDGDDPDALLPAQKGQRKAKGMM